MAMIVLTLHHAAEYRESLKRLNEGKETMEEHLKFKAAKEKEDLEWSRADRQIG